MDEFVPDSNLEKSGGCWCRFTGLEEKGKVEKLSKVSRPILVTYNVESDTGARFLQFIAELSKLAPVTSGTTIDNFHFHHVRSCCDCVM